MRSNVNPEDQEYIGNIWGWKFSLFGLVLILFLLGLMVYRHYSLGVPFGEMEVLFNEKTYYHSKLDSVQVDSIN